MLKVERRNRVIVIGDSGVGKSHLLPGDEAGVPVDRAHPTRGEQFTTTNRNVSRNPARPHDPPHRPVSMMCREIGGGVSAGTLLSQSVKIRGQDVVVIVFDATRLETYANVWRRWAPHLNTLMENSHRAPFLALVETHADKLSRARLARHRRAVEIDLYMAFENRFIYAQLCARAEEERDAFWDQIAVQLRWQPRRHQATVSIVQQTFDGPDSEGGLWNGALARLRSLLRLLRDQDEAEGYEDDLTLSEFTLL